MLRTFIPEIDGLRAVAITLVMLFHLEVPGFSLGWSGVPLFFVISGFLITGILLDLRERPFIDFLRIFFARRALRIFPLYYAYLLLSMLLLGVLGRPFVSLVSYLFYFQNYAIGLNINEVPSILGHTWSLAVEEQFYIIWPFVVFFIRGQSFKYLCMGLIAVAGPVRWLIYHATDNVHLTVVALPSNMDLLAYGGLLAVWHRDGRYRNAPLWLALLGLASCAFFISRTGLDAFWRPASWVPGNPALLTCLAFVFGAPVWLSAKGRTGFCKAILASSPCQAIGQISYGLYMWHLLCFMLIARVSASLGIAAPLKDLVSIGASIGIAQLSYSHFESRFLRMKNRFT